jgi:hypothetical protein
VIDIEATLLQQFLNIAQRKRVAKIPPDRTKYEAGFGLPPFEDRRSGYHFAILSRHQPATSKVATHPPKEPVWSKISNALKRLGFRFHNFLAQLLSETSRACTIRVRRSSFREALE